MKPVNLFSLRQVDRTCISQPELFDMFTRNFGMKPMKSQEKADIMSFIDRLAPHINHAAKVNSFYIGYTIPQISKELDLLRLGENYHLNIEIKHKSSFERIKKQLQQNYYYLRALGSEVHLFLYVVSTGETFTIDASNNVSLTNFTNLIQSITNQQFTVAQNLDELFSPKKYLVSPLNSTDKFMRQEYFLTDHQESIKKDIIRGFDNQTLKCALISGAAGTGKTLLTYDIASHYIQNMIPVKIVHCGKLSEGHLKLINEYNWSIDSIANYNRALSNVQDGEIIIFDEAQRIRTHQIDDILDRMVSINARFIFSYDPKQYISNNENKASRFENLQVSHQFFELTTKIRTNKEIASFIVNLFDLSKINTSSKFEYKNIYIQFFDDENSLRDFLQYLRRIENWVVLNYTGSNHNRLSFDSYQSITDKNAHEVLGQEFDKVAVVINEYFKYDQGRLFGYSHPAKYQMTQMLFQNLTRTREELYIIIYKNIELLEACLKILGRENVKTTIEPIMDKITETV